MENNKGVVCAEWICMELRDGSGQFPFTGKVEQIGEITLGGFTPRGDGCKHIFAHRVKGNVRHLEFYTPVYPGRLSGNRLLMTLVVEDDLTYTMKTHEPLSYDCVALRVAYKEPVPATEGL